MRIIKSLLLLILVILTISFSAFGQEDSRPITMEEYELAKTFVIEDLDNDTYVKFDNKYILDRYELRKPIFITGDDGLKKRVDLYKLVAREGLMDLGVMVFYTTETGTIYKALVPNYMASGEVWEMYFEDIHSIDKVEENFVLKLSYVLSREFSFQMLNSSNEGELSGEHATYGSDICFPGDQLVTLANGSEKLLSDIKMGDEVISVDPWTKESSVVKVNKLVSHKPENYAITVLTLIKEERKESLNQLEINLSIRELKATPNHPMQTESGSMEIGEIRVGEMVLSWNQSAKKYDTFTVYSTEEIVEGIQPVYSIEADAGTTLMMNGVMVKQKK